MEIRQSEFVASFAKESQCPPATEGVPEFAFIGRSNVGKSSLINMLTGRKGLAKVSGTPGKTQLLNYFRINNAWYLVDLPGYGYAKAPMEKRNRWSTMMQGYLRHCRQLVGVVQLVDVRHEPSREDREMVSWLRQEKVPFCLVATKCDKLGPTRVKESVRAIVKSLELPATQPVVAFSSETGAGKTELLAWIGATLEHATRG